MMYQGSYGSPLPGGAANLNLSRRKGSIAPSSIASDDRFWVALGFFFILIPWAPYHLIIRPHLNYVRDDIDRMQKQQKRQLADLQKATKKVQKLNVQSSTLEEENNALLYDLRDHGDTIDTETNKYREGEEREEVLLKKIDVLQDAIQRKSRDSVINT
jgi:lipid II:glycine glycyltransferase (peptidoglycan interpeptide bridge formation enzyme)